MNDCVAEQKDSNAKLNVKIQDLAESIACGTRERDEIGELLSMIAPKLKFFIWKFFQNDHDTNDVLGNVMEKILLKMHSYNPQYKFTTWAFNIAKNESLLFKYNKRGNFIDIDEVFSEVEGVADDYDENMARENELNEMCELTHMAILAMPEGINKQILLEKEVNKMKGKDIAAKYDMNENTVKTRIRAAKAEVRNIMVADFPRAKEYFKRRVES